MKLVLLAAGHGRRFGGLKQIAPIGPHGEALMDYTVLSAEECGFDGIVLVVREEIREQLVAHVGSRWPTSMAVEVVVQPERPGTAYAVLCAQALVDGPFAVANADDLYETDALDVLSKHFAPIPMATTVPAPHVLVAYDLANTVLTASELKRGICRVGPSGILEDIVEHHVRRAGGGSFATVPLSHASSLEDSPVLPTMCDGRELVSTNLWGFAPRIFDHLAEAIAPFEPGGPDREILLPEVVGSLVSEGRDEVRVVTTTSRCYGVTHQEDVPFVRAYLEREHLEARQTDR